MSRRSWATSATILDATIVDTDGSIELEPHEVSTGPPVDRFHGGR